MFKNNKSVLELNRPGHLNISQKPETWWDFDIFFFEIKWKYTYIKKIKARCLGMHD